MSPSLFTLAHLHNAQHVLDSGSCSLPVHRTGYHVLDAGLCMPAGAHAALYFDGSLVIPIFTWRGELETNTTSQMMHSRMGYNRSNNQTLQSIFNNKKPNQTIIEIHRLTTNLDLCHSGVYHGDAPKAQSRQGLQPCPSCPGQPITAICLANHGTYVHPHDGDGPGEVRHLHWLLCGVVIESHVCVDCPTNSAHFECLHMGPKTFKCCHTQNKFGALVISTFLKNCTS